MSIDLTNISNADLESELARRREILYEKYLEFLQEEKLRNYVKINDALALLEHRSNSCSDDHTCNSYLTDSGHPKCRRCYIVEQKNNREWDSNLTLVFKVDLETVDTFDQWLDRQSRRV